MLRASCARVAGVPSCGGTNIDSIAVAVPLRSMSSMSSAKSQLVGGTTAGLPSGLRAD